MIRRAPKLVDDVEPARVWRLRLADGTVREPLNHLHVRALVETGLATADSELAAAGTDAWQRLGDHPLWPNVAPPATTARLTVPVTADPGVVRNEVHAPTPKMQALLDEHHEAVQSHLTVRAAREDLGYFLQALGFASAVAGLICVGDIIVFTCQLVVAFVFLVAFVRLISLWLIWRVLR